MSKHVDEMIIWTQLLGFEWKDEDHGVERYLKRLGFHPQAICLLTYHPDFVQQHMGMDTECILPPDICGYRGGSQNLPRNPWTNWDVRELVSALHAQGIECYFTLMGDYVKNMYHHEWISDHHEVMIYGADWEGAISPLKRFNNGTYYEDFFADKITQTMLDYGFDGAHLADCFCPQPCTVQHGDFSADMFDQFITDTGITCPESILNHRNSNEHEYRRIRGEWLWSESRSEWIRFNARRWEKFLTKICAAAHKYEKKIMLLGMYVSDPFESLYCLGFDAGALSRSGVDMLTPNIVPTGCYMNDPTRPFLFHRYMTIAMLFAALTEGVPKYGMLGIKDEAEEWDILHTVPTKLERDIYTMPSYRLCDGESCLNGFFLTLGDGIITDEWAWAMARVDVAFEMDGAKPITPCLFWSNDAHYAMLDEYIRTRRWTTHKFVYMLEEAGAYMGGVLTASTIASHTGALFVPNFDLLNDMEKRAVLEYRGGAVLALMPADKEMPNVVNCQTFTDCYSPYSMRACLWNAPGVKFDINDADDGLIEDDTFPEVGDIMQHEIPFRKVSRGFIVTCAGILKTLGLPDGIESINVPFNAFLLQDGLVRLYLYSRYEERFDFAQVSANKGISEATTVSKSPIGKIHYVKKFITDIQNPSLAYAGNDADVHFAFQMKIAPGGVGIADVKFSDN